MTESRLTLLDYLRTANPELDCTGCRPGPTNTTQGKFLYKSPGAIQPWKDFEFDKLKVMDSGDFQKLLESRHDFQDYSGIAEMPYRRIYDEASLESFLDIWNWRVVSEALAAAQDGHADSSRHGRVFMARGGQACFPEMPVKREGTNRRLRPDWAGIIQQPGSPDQPPNILPGDTKLSCKWHSSKIESGRVPDIGNVGGWLPAIRQTYTYCIKTNAQYGYLLTDQELLAVRISWLPVSDDESFKPSTTIQAQRRGILEYKAIPWDHDETETNSSAPGLTINLALWWLHMMAAVAHEMKEHKDAAKEAQHTPADPRKASEGFVGSQDSGLETPSESGDQQLFDLHNSQIFRSETSDVRHALSTTGLDSQGRQTSPTPASSRRKRNREEPELSTKRSHVTRRVNPLRKGKH
ncbi:MAG: hypothetical protein Q9221_001529 [Calogaya cf. arnoldii]